MTKIRRTKEEIEAGVTLTQKKDMIDKALINKSEARKNGIKNPAVVSPTIYDEYDPETKTVYKYKTRTIEKEIVKELPVIKEVRILNGAKGSEKTIQEFLDIELRKCRWEWKELKMDGDFTSAKMKALGKDGWHMTHILDWKIIKPEWKDKPSTMYFQKPVHRK